MTAALDAAVAALFRAGLSDFVTERKRLSAELKATGDKDGSAKLAKLQRPPVSAWTVNQLWWRQRDSFEALLAAAAQVKAGDRDASRAHRQALSGLRDHATAILKEAGNAASESTLRRITTTLAALAASGGFDPDPPGALVSDRDPPGFETFVAGTTAPRSAAPAASKRDEEAARRRAEEAERQRRAEERKRLSAGLRDARHLLGEQQRDVTRLRSELDAAEQSLKETQALLAELEQQLSSL